MVVQSSDVPSRNPGFKFGLFAKGNMDVKTRRVEARYFWGGPKQKTIKHQGMVNCWFGARCGLDSNWIPENEGDCVLRVAGLNPKPTLDH